MLQPMGSQRVRTQLATEQQHRMGENSGAGVRAYEIVILDSRKTSNSSSHMFCCDHEWLSYPGSEVIYSGKDGSIIHKSQDMETM